MKGFLLGERVNNIFILLLNTDMNMIVSRIARFNNALDSVKDPECPHIPMSRRPYKFLLLDKDLEDSVITEFVKSTDSYSHDMEFIEAIKRYLSLEFLKDRIMWCKENNITLQDIIDDRGDYTDDIIDALGNLSVSYVGNVSGDIEMSIVLKESYNMDKELNKGIVDDIVNHVYKQSGVSRDESQIKEEIRSELDYVLVMASNFVIDKILEY